MRLFYWHPNRHHRRGCGLIIAHVKNTPKSQWPANNARPQGPASMPDRLGREITGQNLVDLTSFTSRLASQPAVTAVPTVVEPIRFAEVGCSCQDHCYIEAVCDDVVRLRDHDALRRQLGRYNCFWEKGLHSIPIGRQEATRINTHSGTATTRSVNPILSVPGPPNVINWFHISAHRAGDGKNPIRWPIEVMFSIPEQIFISLCALAGCVIAHYFFQSIADHDLEVAAKLLGLVAGCGLGAAVVIWRKSHR